MTREEAIAILEVSKHMATSGRMYNQAIDMAIEALSEAQVDVGLINKDAVSREGLLKSWEELSPRGRTEFDQVIMTIPALPSADAVHGEWVRKYDDKINCYWYECDQCGEYRPRNQFGNEYNANYCPNCGAKMKGGDTE